MKEKEKMYLYKYGSIGLILIDLFMLYKCMFFEVSEKLVSYLQFGGSFLGGLGSLTSDALQSVMSSLSKGNITLWEFQKIYAAIADYTYSSEEGEALYTMTQIFYWFIVAFVVAGIIEAVIHMCNGKFNGLFCLADFLLGAGVFYFWWVTVSAFEDEFGSSAIRFTPWAIAVMVIPFIVAVFWGGYLSTAEKIKENGSCVQEGTVLTEEQIYFNTKEWGLFLRGHKNVILVLTVYFILHILPLIFGFSMYDILPYINLLDAIVVGIMLICAVHHEWKIPGIYVIFGVIGNLILYHEYLEYYNFYYLVEIMGGGLILILCMYFLMKLKLGKYKLAVMCGVTVLLKAVLLPLFGEGYFTPNHYYATIMDIIGRRYTIYQIAGIIIPIIIYMVKPDIVYKFMNFNPDIDMPVENGMENTEREKPDERKPDTYTEIRKIDLKLKETKEKIEHAYETIGLKLCEIDGSNDAAYQELQNSIERLKKENAQIEERINWINGIRVCPKCFAKNNVENIYCMQCGKKLVNEEKEDQ